MPRNSQAISAKRRVARIQLGVEAAGDQGADRERERDREDDVARVEHRRVDHHARVAEQRVEADALGRHRAEAGERVGVGNSISPVKKAPRPISTAVAQGTISR